MEAHGCDRAALRDVRQLQGLFSQIIDEMALHPIDDGAWHKFPGAGGVTGLRMLAESHLACHTFPEFGSLCLNLFCCRPRPDCNFEELLRQGFQAASVQIRKIDRPFIV